MPSLSSQLRRLLERAIAGNEGARHIAESGAEQSLQRLGVGSNKPHSSLSPLEQVLRNQLRAHGRQVGDTLDLQRGTQTIDHLKQAVAYEHWHRLLFARFLAENHLLIHPQHGVALSLDEIKGLALGLSRDWIELAAEFAQQMLLREVFRSDDPVLRVPLSPEKRLELERKLDSLPREIFVADDSLGWVYQFWQKDAKERVNRSAVTIGADELPPNTQLFTEDYMVLFLLENTLGAWWTARHGKADLRGYEWTYLRLDEQGFPAAGAFKNWPKSVRELRVLDPCMGSGHFLTFALPILARMRAQEEHIPLQDAITAVLRENLFGLELDPRCSQIAAFNLALSAWKLAGGHFDLPPLNLACSGYVVNAEEADWIRLAGKDERKQELMKRLYSLFANAPILGSLIDPFQVGGPLLAGEIVELMPLLDQALAAEDDKYELHEILIAAKGLIESARTLGSRFTLVVTNVPFLGRGRQSEVLHHFSHTHYNDAADNLAQVFFDRCLRLLGPGSTTALIAPQTWTYGPRYKKYRRRLLNQTQLNLVAILGSGAFREITGEVVDPGAFVVTAGVPPSQQSFAWLDATPAKSVDDKSEILRSGMVQHFAQTAMFGNQSCLVRPPFSSSVPLLGEFAFSVSGLKSGDSERYNRYFWEIPNLDDNWEVLQSAAEDDGTFEGLTGIIFWEQGTGELAQLAQRMKGVNHVVQNWRRGQAAWGKRGIAVSATGRLRSCKYLGDRFDSAVTVIVPKDPGNLDAILRFCTSPEFAKSIKHIDNKLSVTTATLLNVPFDLNKWQGSTTPSEAPNLTCSNHKQWIFSGHPREANDPLQVAVARLVGYLWPRQSGSDFDGFPALPADGLADSCASDGIVCLDSVAGEDSAGSRLRALLQASLGDDYNLSHLLNGKQSLNLDAWLRNEFFAEHCQFFRHRPFVWHLWDGQKDGFHALINYHKLDRRTLEKLIYSYLGDWIARQRQEVVSGEEGADTRLAAAQHLQEQLKRILVGEHDAGGQKQYYDIFLRWKSLDRQPLGWEPDLNDGVRMNIRPWLTQAKLYKCQKPGILRITPNIKYTKDDGKEPPRDPKSFPWFDGSTDRINDHHLSLADKRSAQGLK